MLNKTSQQFKMRKNEGNVSLRKTANQKSDKRFDLDRKNSSDCLRDHLLHK